ncbi:Putative F-box protein [Dendrobium catenatum]|uniref:F-box protein n=1 Tax=Dendrobium catenatum TaxID=906689 RepID=A0A2I0WNC0_9ASPA|nr:Putative F-box protein [Dendrobium catenatum]
MAWSDLPKDLLCSISSQLPIVDFIRFSVVCTSWNYVVANNIILGNGFHPSPWLLLPDEAGEASGTLTFYDIAIKEEGGLDRHHNLSSLGYHISGHRCIGSNDGWLVTLDKIDLQPRIFNPLTKAEICLPSLFTIPEEQCHSIMPEYASDGSFETFYNEIHPQFSTNAKSIHEIYFGKIVISSNDSHGTAIVIHGYRISLALTKPDDQAWELGPQMPYYDTNELEEFEDIFYHKEEQRFYAITHFSMVLAFDLKGQNIEVICPPIQDPLTINSDCKNYIFFLLGNLLKVEREITDLNLQNNRRHMRPGPGEPWCNDKTSRISVLKLGPDVTSSCSFSQWIPVEDLEGFSIFIGCNQTFALHHKVAPGIRPNCVYFNDQWDAMSPMKVAHDFGLYDLQNHCFEYFVYPDSQPKLSPSIWFMPSFT